MVKNIFMNLKFVENLIEYKLKWQKIVVNPRGFGLVWCCW